MDKIAVLIPCYNESATIAKVIADYRAVLPEATIYVYDNNNIFSTSYDILFSYLGNGAECDRPLSNQNMGSELLGVRRSVIKVADSP